MEQTLEEKTKLFWVNEKPKLDLTPLEKTMVAISTQKDYDELMQVYETGGWRWGSRDLPIFYNYLAENKEKVFVDAGISFSGNLKGFFEYGYEEPNNYSVVSTKKFYEIQGITKEELAELNEYFEKNFPNRASKGRNRALVN